MNSPDEFIQGGLVSAVRSIDPLPASDLSYWWMIFPMRKVSPIVDSCLVTNVVRLNCHIQSLCVYCFTKLTVLSLQF